MSVVMPNRKYLPPFLVLRTRQGSAWRGVSPDDFIDKKADESRRRSHSNECGPLKLFNWHRCLSPLSELSRTWRSCCGGCCVLNGDGTRSSDSIVQRLLRLLAEGVNALPVFMRGDLYLSCKRRSLWRLVSGVCVSPTRGRDALATAGGTPALQSFFPAAVKACPSQTIYEMGCQVELRMSLSQMGSRRSRPEVGRLLNGPVDRFEEHSPVSG